MAEPDVNKSSKSALDQLGPATASSSSSAQHKVCAQCTKICYRQGRGCSKCSNWFHLVCAKLTKVESSQLVNWECSDCLGRSSHRNLHSTDELESIREASPMPNVTVSASTSAPSLLCQECGAVNDRKPGRLCHSCPKYYHLSCVKLTKRTSAGLPVWKCKACIRTPSLGIDTAHTATPSPHRQLSARRLIAMRKSVRVPVKIPKAARIAAADALATAIEHAVGDVGPDPWSRLLSFASLALGQRTTAGNVRSSLARGMKAAIAAFDSCVGDDDGEVRDPINSPGHQQGGDLRRAVNSKLAQGDVAAAVRLVASSDTVLEPTDEVLTALRLKHPPAPTDSRAIPVPDPAQSVTLSTDDVRKALKSFRPSSSGGIDGLRPGHLIDLTADSTAEAGIRLISAMTKLCNRLVSGSLPQHARDLMFSANLTALRKKDGGIRPIAVGNTFRRLASKAACRPCIGRLAAEFAPVQLGVGVPGGCEAAAHAVRSIVSSRQNPSSPQAGGSVLVKLDMRNAFNTIRRDHLLETCHRRAPSVYKLAHLAYFEPSDLVIDDILIKSDSGIQQGDPLGPLLFALGVDDIARSVSTPTNIWYLDDATLGGTPSTVCENLRRIVPALADIGLIINPTKSEIINIDCNESDFTEAVAAVNQILDCVGVTSQDELFILGSPILQPAIISDLAKKRSTMELMTKRLGQIDAHPALFLLRNCFSLPRLLYSLRSSPCYAAMAHLQDLDDLIRRSAADICNTCFSDTGWRQATLPISLGGLGLRSPKDVAGPAYNASVHSSRSLVESILLETTESPLDSVITDINTRWTAAGLQLPPDLRKQRQWDRISAVCVFSSLKETMDQHQLACLQAASQPHSGAWLTALPSSATGNLVEDDCLRYAVAMRVGCRVCEPHRCRCGLRIDELGLHPLSCSRSAGRFPRHMAINDIVRRALNVAGYYSILEPVGLDRGDGKRPDGITVYPFSAGKPLVWDATCTDTFAPSVAIESAVDPGRAARVAEERKTAKYANFCSRYIFTPVAVETSGVYGPASLNFLEDLGRRMARRTGDLRETAWLFERLSVAIIRGNHLSLVASSRH